MIIKNRTKGRWQMTVSYDPLWKTLKRKQISQYYLIHHHGISANQLHRMHKNMYVSTRTLELLCKILKCRVEDVIEMR